MNEYELGLRHLREHPLVEMIESGETFKITRDGAPVAVCLPIEEYERLIAVRPAVGAIANVIEGIEADA